MFALGLVFILINLFFEHFPGINYVPAIWWLFLPAVIPVFLLSSYALKNGISPRMAAFSRYYCLYYFISLCMAVLTTGIQSTSFPVIDKVLAHWDQLLGVNTVKILAWVAVHLAIKMVLAVCYTGIVIQLFIVPPLLSLFKSQNQLNQFLLLYALSFILGALIYYCFPTAAPVSIFSSPYFSAEQHDTFIKFFELHHYIHPTTSRGGMIAFPSMHVVWAIILTYVTRDRRWLFYPLAIINLIAIAATVLLGWHYLIDVFGGILVAIISIYIVSALSNKGNQGHQKNA